MKKDILISPERQQGFANDIFEPAKAKRYGVVLVEW